MLLAEALKERADLQTLVAQLHERLDANARVQEGEKPTEDPRELLTKLDEALARLEYLMVHINKTNAVSKVGDETLMALLAKRDCLKQKMGILRSFLNEASDLTSRMCRDEIKVLPTVAVAEQQNRLDKLSQDLRLLEVRIQQSNWNTELL